MGGWTGAALAGDAHRERRGVGRDNDAVHAQVVVGDGEPRCGARTCVYDEKDKVRAPGLLRDAGRRKPMATLQPAHAYDEVVTFLVSGPSRQEIGAFRLSDGTLSRLRQLLQKKSAATLTGD